jgi:hypothetical protein
LDSQAHVFAQRALPLLSFADTQKVMSILAGVDGQKFLDDAWKNAANYCDPDSIQEPDGLSYSISPTGATGLVVCVEMPPPKRPGEVYFSAIFVRYANPEDPDVSRLHWMRYFNLEMNTHPVTQKECTMLCEWTAQAKYNVYGEGPVADPDEFIQASLTHIWHDAKDEQQNEE